MERYLLIANNRPKQPSARYNLVRIFLNHIKTNDTKYNCLIKNGLFIKKS